MEVQECHEDRLEVLGNYFFFFLFRNGPEVAQLGVGTMEFGEGGGGGGGLKMTSSSVKGKEADSALNSVLDRYRSLHRLGRLGNN